MKNKGFTLIELIAVVVMMGMIILIVFPATTRILKSNEDKKYDNYYDSIQEAIELYARTRREELGGIKGNGCIDDKKLSELADYDYIKKYEEEDNVSCLSPGDFSTDLLNALGINTSKQYDNIRIENKNGKIKVKYSMICVRNYDDPSSISLLYSNLVEKKGSCEIYIPVVTNSLLQEIKEKYTTELKGSVSYVTGSPNNNYVYYSGRLWRIISFDKTDRTIKLVSDDIVSILNYDNKKDGSGNFSNNYSTSNINLWLNNNFLPTLRNTEKYLLDIGWNYSAVANNVTEPITTGNTFISKVGMMNNYEYLKSSNYINNGKKFWLLSTKSGGNNDNAWYVNTSGQITNSIVSNFYGVRPAIVLKPNVTVVNGGNGTKNNPYKLTGDTTANVGEKLNSRFPGEYVTFNGVLFRISSTEASFTKLIAKDTIPIDSNIISGLTQIGSEYYNTVDGTIGFHVYDKLYSDNTFIGSYLKEWASSVEEDLTSGDFCRMPISNITSQTVECPQESIINSKIAIPKIGDMYAVYSNNEYWTMNEREEDRINVISTDCSVRDISINDLSSILPVVVIKNTVYITGGNGTLNNPYTIE